MNLTSLSQDEPWMTPEERERNRQFIQATTDHLAIQGVPETPLIVLRVNDVIATWLLVRRLETALAPAEDGAAPCPTIAQAGAIGKCRDRLRSAIKDLEASCPGAGAFPAQGRTKGTHPTTRQETPGAPANRSNPENTQEPKSNTPKPPNNPESEHKSTSEPRQHIQKAKAQSTKEHPNTPTAPPAAKSRRNAPPEKPRPGAREEKSAHNPQSLPHLYRTPKSQTQAPVKTPSP